MTQYVYPAIFTKEESGLYAVSFPDIQGCLTGGESLEDAIYMAEDALALMLYCYERDKKEIPTASRMEDIQVPEGSFVNYIRCDTLEYRKRNNNKAVKKTLTVPEWLNEAATEANLNFSQVLQEALKGKLGIS